MKSYAALFLFAGLGGGALGFQRARATFRGVEGRFRVAGAIDNDPAAAHDFHRLTGHPCTVADLATMSPDELRAACPEPPDVLFTSPPCKSFSGCLPSATAATPKYRDMADLAVRGLFLALETWPSHRPRLVLMENVPRIQSRGRHLLDVIVGMLRSYGYATRETVHDCGELGGLAQRRRRFLLVARHVETTGDWWREPPKKRVRGVGEVLGELPIPLPGTTDGGPMHRLPRLSALNWLRLALIPAGGDWRKLPPSVRLAPRAGRINGGFGVEAWDEAAHSVVAEGTVRNTWGSVADPRLSESASRHEARMRVESFDAPAHTVTSSDRIGSGAPSIADPRPGYASRAGGHGVQDWAATGRTVIGQDPRGLKGGAVADPRLANLDGRFHGGHGVDAWDVPAGTVLGAATTSRGAAVADPRMFCEPRGGVMGVDGWTAPAGAVLGNARPDNGPFSVADPRVGCVRREGGHGVTRWDRPIAAVIGHATIQNHPCQVADPRALGLEVGCIVETAEGPVLIGIDLDLSDPRPVARPPIILAVDGTWHRPMTTLELAALQSLPTRLDDGEWLVLTGNQAKQRELVGNAVPAASAEAIATTGLLCLLPSAAGAVTLGSDPIWVGPSAEALDA